MPQIEVDERTYRELELLAVAWHTTIADVVARLVIAVATRLTVRPGRPGRPALPPVPVYAVDAGIRIEARYEPQAQHLTVCGGPLRGQTYTSPSVARRAVVAVLDPTVSPARWEAQNGRYGVSCAVALGEMVGRAETDVQP